MLPQHPPEVLHRLIERTLGGNVGVPEEDIVRPFLQFPRTAHSPVSVAVDEAGVDVVAALDAPERLETDATGLEGKDVDQAVFELVDLQAGGDKSSWLRLHVRKVFELQLHGGDVVAGVRLHQVLDVLVEVPGGDLGVPRQDGLEERETLGWYLHLDSRGVIYLIVTIIYWLLTIIL